jgi:hypothetical protein
MKITVDEKIREKRIQEIHDLYNLIIADNENAKEELYTLMKKAIEDNKDEAATHTANAIYEILETNLSTTLTELRKIYSKSFNEETILDLQEIFYQEDGKTLEERIENWFNEVLSDKPTQDEMLILFYHLSMIVDTESFNIISYTMKNKLDTTYVEIVAGEGCDICNEYCNGEVYEEDEIELPPYHPSCTCEPIYYEKEDIIGDI